MARKKEPTYVVFGAGPKPNKAVAGIKRNDGNGVGVMICEMQNGERKTGNRYLRSARIR